MELDFIRLNTLTDLANISTYWVENWNYDVIFQLEGAVYPPRMVFCAVKISLEWQKSSIQGLTWLQHERTVAGTGNDLRAENECGVCCAR